MSEEDTQKRKRESESSESELSEQDLKLETLEYVMDVQSFNAFLVELRSTPEYAHDWTRFCLRFSQLFAQTMHLESNAVSPLLCRRFLEQAPLLNEQTEEKWFKTWKQSKKIIHYLEK